MCKISLSLSVLVARRKAKRAKEAGDAIYWPIYIFDITNPHKQEETQRDPDELLAEYKNLLADIDKTREALKNELIDALGNPVRQKKTKQTRKKK